MKSPSHGQDCHFNQVWRWGWRGGWQKDSSALAKPFNLIFHSVLSCCFSLSSLMCVFVIHHCRNFTSSAPGSTVHPCLCYSWQQPAPPLTITYHRSGHPLLRVLLSDYPTVSFLVPPWNPFFFITLVSSSDPHHPTDDSTPPQFPASLIPILTVSVQIQISGASAS